MTMRTSARIQSYHQDFNQGCVQLFVTDCAACGVVFALTAGFEESRREDGREWHCPNGHSMVFAKTEEVEKAKRIRAEQAAERLRSRVANLEDDVRVEKIAHASTKGQLTKTKKRAVAGLCPCCSRSFVDVRRHMASKHPDEALGGLGDGKP